MSILNEIINITGITYLVFMGFFIILIGYLLGRIRIKGVGLGTAGVFIIALLFGVMFKTEIGQTITQKVAGETVDISMNALISVSLNQSKIALYTATYGKDTVAPSSPRLPPVSDS